MLSKLHSPAQTMQLNELIANVSKKIQKINTLIKLQKKVDEILQTWSSKDKVIVLQKNHQNKTINQRIALSTQAPQTMQEIKADQKAAQTNHQTS